MALENEGALLREHGHEVQTLLFKNRAHKGSGKIFAGIRAFNNRGAARQLEKIINEFRPGIIHIHNLFFEASPSMIRMAKKHRLPVVLTLHNYRLICCNALLLRNGKPCELCIHADFPLHGIRYRCYHHSAADSALVTGITGTHKLAGTWKRVDTFIALTDFARQKFLHSSLGVKDEQVAVKPNFIPDPGIGRWPREDFFLYAGRLSSEKGIEDLAAAFEGLPGCRLVVAGEGPLQEQLRNRFGHCTNISFIGKTERKEILELMKSCKALILPSRWYEMLAFTLVEAMATGTPVIASHLLSLSGLIRDGFNGMLFDAGDVQGLRDAVKEFSKKENMPIYQNARDTYLHKYGPDIHYDSIISIYNAAIAKMEIKKNSNDGSTKKSA